MFLGKCDKFHNPLIEALSEPAFVFNEKGDFLFCNYPAQHILKLLDYAPDRKPENIHAFTQILKFASANADESILALEEMKHHLTHSRFEDGQMLRLIPVQENKYFQAQRLEALGELAGGIAHDFNNILSIIDGYARMACKVSKGNDSALDYLAKIKKLVERGAGLTGRLLTFGHHGVTKADVMDLGDFIRDQEPLLRQLMDASIEFTLQIEENIYAVVTPDHIFQILMNLCINARDAMKSGGRLLIECGDYDHEKVYFSVTDNGEGMPPEIQSRIFDPFFTTKERGKGTGLGLSIVYRLVKDMKGEMEVQSKVGEGTSIRITLPLSTIIKDKVRGQDNDGKQSWKFLIDHWKSV